MSRHTRSMGKSGRFFRPSRDPKSVDFRGEGFVRIAPLLEDRNLPLLIEPKVKDLQLHVWAKNHPALISEKLYRHGAILFRGFHIRTTPQFELVIDAFIDRSTDYMEGATPRTRLSAKVYTSTEFPPDQTIALHNELSYVNTWPMRLLFCCEKPAQSGGETPIADVRQVYRRLHPEITDRFAPSGWMLVRNFGDGLGPTWQYAFHKEDKASLEAYFRQADVTWEWKDADHLRTRQVRSAVAEHPVTGEKVWFNHLVFWHQSSLEPAMLDLLSTSFKEDGFPYNTFYGDGAPVEARIVDRVRDAYERETVTFPWREGDVLLLDNMLVAHGRRPFEGARSVWAAMGNPNSRRWHSEREGR